MDKVNVTRLKFRRLNPVEFTLLAFFAGFACGYMWGIK